MTHVYRTDTERAVEAEVARLFMASSDSVEVRLENFPKYVRRTALKRFLAMYELFKLALPVKGSVVECGVFRGFGVSTWAKLSTILEPENLTRRIYGFDTFGGFPTVSAADAGAHAAPQRGELSADSQAELEALFALYDRDRFLGHIPKVELIRGDIVTTAPAFVEQNPHVLVSLLVLDCDLYEPTKAALEAFVPRMPRGAVLAFDELDNPKWPGETRALLETLGVRRFALQRLPWDPYLSYAILD